MNTSILASGGRRQRRRHSAEFKAAVIQACQQPGVSIAAIALANGLNANMLRKWVIDSEGAIPAAATEHRQIAADRGAQFIALAPPAASVPREIRVEVQRRETAIKVTWPGEAASECAAWLRELLR